MVRKACHLPGRVIQSGKGSGYENKPHVSRMDKKHGATGLGGRLEPADGLCHQFHGANQPAGAKATEAKGE
jgi:hypothetical protein